MSEEIMDSTHSFIQDLDATFTDNLRTYLKEAFNFEAPLYPELIQNRPYLRKLCEILYASLKESIGKTLEEKTSELFQNAIQHLLCEATYIHVESEHANKTLKKISSGSLVTLNTLNKSTSPKNKQKYLDKIRTLKEEKQSLQEEVNGRGQRITDLESEMELLKIECDKRVADLTNKLCELKASIKIQKVKEHQLLDRYEEIESQLNNSKNQNHLLKSAIREKSEKLNNTRKLLSVSNAKIAEYESEMQTMSLSELNSSQSKPSSPIRIVIESPKSDVQREDLETQIELVTNELNASKDLLRAKEAEITGSQLRLAELEEEVRGLTYENDHLKKDLLASTNDRTVLDASQSMAQETIDSLNNEIKYLKDEIEKIKGSINFSGSNQKFIDFLRAKIRIEEQLRRQCAVSNGLADFISKMIEGKDAEFAPLDIPEFNKEECRKAIAGALVMVSDSEQIPLFDCAAGFRTAARRVVDLLAEPGNESVIPIISMLSAVNKRALETLASIRHRVNNLKTIFPDIESEDQLIEEALTFIHKMQPILSLAKREMVNVFGATFEETQPAQSLGVFVDEVHSLTTNIETELRPIVGLEIPFQLIPSTIRDLVEEFESELKNQNNRSITSEKIISEKEKALIEKNNSLEKEIQHISYTLAETIAKSRKLEEKNVELKRKCEDRGIAAAQFERTNLTLKEKCDRLEKKVECLNVEVASLKESLQNRTEQFDRRVEKIIKSEQERHDEEIKRIEKIQNQQLDVLKQQASDLALKLKNTKSRTREMQIAFDSTIKKQREELAIANSSILELSSNETFVDKIGQILDACFRKEGKWNERKVEKAVLCLVEQIIKRKPDFPC